MKKIITSILIDDNDTIIPEKYKSYYKDSSIRLNDFADSLAVLFLDYYKDDFEGIRNFRESFKDDSKDVSEVSYEEDDN